MGELSWREIKKVKVPDPEASVWTPALDYVTPGRLYLIAVEPRSMFGSPPSSGEQKWKPEKLEQCTADGDPSRVRVAPLTLDGCSVGALIGKIGGSTADIKVDPAKLIVFSAGRRCVFSVTDPAKTGGLYLGINDTVHSVTKVQGQLEVTLFEAL